VQGGEEGVGVETLGRGGVGEGREGGLVGAVLGVGFELAGLEGCRRGGVDGGFGFGGGRILFIVGLEFGAFEWWW